MARISIMHMRVTFLLALAGLLRLPVTCWGQEPQAHEPATAVGTAEPAAAPAEVPTALEVAYRNGKLTIRAQHVPLVDVLRAVSSETGARIDAPSGANAWITDSVGPGPTKDVLGSLLGRAQFNYSLVMSASDPNSPARITVFPNAGLQAQDIPQAGLNVPRRLGPRPGRRGFGNVVPTAPRRIGLKPGETPLLPEETRVCQRTALKTLLKSTMLEDRCVRRCEHAAKRAERPPEGPCADVCEQDPRQKGRLDKLHTRLSKACASGGVMSAVISGLGSSPQQ